MYSTSFEVVKRLQCAKTIIVDLFHSCFATSQMKTNETEEHFRALMVAAQAGDGRAYSRLLEELTPHLRRVIRRRRSFLAPQDIEDLVQDVLLSIHVVRATYDPKRPLFPWIIAILRNRLADGARRYARREKNEVLVDELPVTFADDRANIEPEVYQDPEELKKALETLPPVQREAIELLKLKEMSLKEAASVTGTSISSLKVSVHRGIASLRKILKK